MCDQAAKQGGTKWVPLIFFREEGVSRLSSSRPPRSSERRFGRGGRGCLCSLPGGQQGTEPEAGPGRAVPSRGGRRLPTERRWGCGALRKALVARRGASVSLRGVLGALRAGVRLRGTSDRPQNSEEPLTGVTGPRRAPCACAGRPGLLSSSVW